MKIKFNMLLSLAAVLLTIIFLWFSNRAVTLGTASWDDVVVEARKGGYELIGTKELADQYLGQPGSLVLVDTRQPWEYRTGHIEGARNFPMEPTWWSRWRKTDDLESFLGPDKSKTIVFY